MIDENRVSMAQHGMYRGDTHACAKSKVDEYISGHN